jgi:hypothetical protein
MALPKIIIIIKLIKSKKKSDLWFYNNHIQYVEQLILNMALPKN